MHVLDVTIVLLQLSVYGRHVSRLLKMSLYQIVPHLHQLCREGLVAIRRWRGWNRRISLHLSSIWLHFWVEVCNDRIEPVVSWRLIALLVSERPVLRAGESHGVCYLRQN